MLVVVGWQGGRNAMAPLRYSTPARDELGSGTEVARCALAAEVRADEVALKSEVLQKKRKRVR